MTMRTLSTGQPATLKWYRIMTAAMLGEESPAVKFLDQKIEKNGEDDEVIQDEGQMILLLMEIHSRGLDEEGAGEHIEYSSEKLPPRSG